MKLRDKVAIVTGASSGIGLATARLFVQEGAHVALVARREAKLAEVAAELGARALPLACDVGDLSRLPWLVEQVVARLGGIDIVVNNAGLHHRGDMFRHPPQALAGMFTVNTVAPMVLTRIAGEHMRRGGCIINVASLAGKLPVPGSATYSGTKAGVRFWAMAAAEDLARLGLRIANVNPGPVDSGFFDADIEHVSPLTFSQPMSSSEQVAEAVLEAALSQQSPLEIDLPRASGRLATVGYLWPSVSKVLRPMLERRGARAKAAFMKRRGLGKPSS